MTAIIVNWSTCKCNLRYLLLMTYDMPSYMHVFLDLGVNVRSCPHTAMCAKGLLFCLLLKHLGALIVGLINGERRVDESRLPDCTVVWFKPTSERQQVPPDSRQRS